MITIISVLGCYTMSDEGEEVLDINDPRVPERIRQTALRFKKPAQFVVDLGDGEFVLYAADGELIDRVILT